MRKLFHVGLVGALAGVLSAQPAGLQPPTGLEASDGLYSTKVGLSWDHVRGARLYRLFRSLTNDPATAEAIGTTPSIIYYDPIAGAGQVHFYWVRAEAGTTAGPLSEPDDGFKAIGKISAFGPIGPLQPPTQPIENPVTGAKVYLGKALFWDEQLSSTRTVACGTCHIFSRAGTDPRVEVDLASTTHPGVDNVFGTEDDVFGSPGVPASRADGSYIWSEEFGFRPQVTRRKAQSMVDAAYSDTGLFWDGRAERTFHDPETGEVVFQNAAPLEIQALESQAVDPFLNDVEMGHIDRTLGELITRIAESQPLALAPSIPTALTAWVSGRGYPELFAEAFGTPEITPVRIAMAIASYERTLYSDRAEIDQTDMGIGEPSPASQRGREIFFDNFCDECHRGPVIGDNRFRFVGIRPDDEDLGRAEVTRKAGDRGRFRTPSLRNIAFREPFMHSGSLATLEDVVEFYDRGGDFDSPNKDANFVRPMRLTDEEKADLAAFMRSLTDQRVVNEEGPLFNRPMLYSESARVPEVFGEGSGPSTIIPEVHALEPPLAGNPNFTVAISNARGGAQAILVIDDTDPASAPEIPTTPSFARVTTTLTGTLPGDGRGSVSIAVPDDPELVGRTFIGRWFVVSGVLQWTTPAFRFTVFEPSTERPAGNVLTSVSAAGLSLGFVAPGSIVSGFGANLATSSASAVSLPLPTTLADIAIQITDAAGSTRQAGMFFASGTQINYEIPPETAEGEAVIEVFRGGELIARGTIQVAAIAPALFSANSNGRGIAAAALLRVAPDGTQTLEPVAEFNAEQQSFTAKPIRLGPENEQLFLVLYGTGIRGRGDQPVTVRVGGVPAEVLFAGPQGEFVGVDQINVRLSRILAGRGELVIELTIGQSQANQVTIHVE